MSTPLSATIKTVLLHRAKYLLHRWWKRGNVGLRSSSSMANFPAQGAALHAPEAPLNVSSRPKPAQVVTAQLPAAPAGGSRHTLNETNETNETSSPSMANFPAQRCSAARAEAPSNVSSRPTPAEVVTAQLPDPRKNRKTRLPTRPCAALHKTRAAAWPGRAVPQATGTTRFTDCHLSDLIFDLESLRKSGRLDCRATIYRLVERALGR
jgi:hypothetical protein